jgi:hypothetical protein
VSKPAGASVAGCCAIPANPAAITPSSNTRTETHLCIIAFRLLKSGFVENTSRADKKLAWRNVRPHALAFYSQSVYRNMTVGEGFSCPMSRDP